MTNELSIPETGKAKSALSAGIASVILFVLFLTPWVGSFVLYGSIITGLVGVVFGAMALKAGQSKGVALTGLILGALTTLVGIGVLVFALLFIGTFSG